MTPEEKARQKIDEFLRWSGWDVQNMNTLNLSAARGDAVREVTLERGHGEVDYLLFGEGRAIGRLRQSPKAILFAALKSSREDTSTAYQRACRLGRTRCPSLTRAPGLRRIFTNYLEPEARSREVFSFHRPETLLEWVQDDSTPQKLLRELPPLITEALWPAQIKAVHNLEHSFALNRPRALIQIFLAFEHRIEALNRGDADAANRRER